MRHGYFIYVLLFLKQALEMGVVSCLTWLTILPKPRTEPVHHYFHHLIAVIISTQSQAQELRVYLKRENRGDHFCLLYS
jgi:hypothetical protein